MKIQKNINKHIFRGYDIRGIWGEDLTEDVAYTVGLGLGSYIQDLGKKRIVVGRDNRTSSPILSNALVKGLLETGVDVVNLGLVTTPMYYFSWDKLGIYSGIMVTASHNPKEYNGFKFAFDERGNAKGEMIQDFREYIEKGEFKTGKGKETKINIEEDYLELIRNSVDLGSRKVKAVIDAGNGTGSVIIKQVFGMFDIDPIYIYCDSDPEFPNHHPDPAIEKNLELVKKKVLKTKADNADAVRTC